MRLFNNKTIFMVYADDGVFIGPDNRMIEAYIMYSGCPIIWVSKLQTDIALSTTESEYSALSKAAREVLWLIALTDIALSTTESEYSALSEAAREVLWLITLTDIALSTTESEYSALSEAAREVLWLINLMKETKKYTLKDTVTVPTIRCIIFEDNEGAKTLAKLPRLSLRTKHINARMHHF
jgi:hypothetical protein